MLTIVLWRAVRAFAHLLWMIAHGLEHGISMLVSPTCYRSNMCCLGSCPTRREHAAYDAYYGAVEVERYRG